MPGMEALRASHIPALGLAAALLASPAIASPIKEPPVFASSSGLLDVMIVAEAKPVTSFAVGGAHPTGGSIRSVRDPLKTRPVQTMKKPPEPMAGRGWPCSRRQAENPLGQQAACDSPGRDRLYQGKSASRAQPHQSAHARTCRGGGANAAPPSAIPTYGDFIFTSVFNPPTETRPRSTREPWG